MGQLDQAIRELENALKAPGASETLLLAEAQSVMDAAVNVGISAVISLLEHPYWLIRSMACESIMDADYMPASSKLVLRMLDENPSVRTRAREALESIHQRQFSPHDEAQLIESILGAGCLKNSFQGAMIHFPSLQDCLDHIRATFQSRRNHSRANCEGH